MPIYDEWLIISMDKLSNKQMSCYVHGTKHIHDYVSRNTILVMTFFNSLMHDFITAYYWLASPPTYHALCSAFLLSFAFFVNLLLITGRKSNIMNAFGYILAVINTVDRNKEKKKMLCYLFWLLVHRSQISTLSSFFSFFFFLLLPLLDTSTHTHST